MLRRLVLTGASVIALTATASAADMYVPGPAAGPGGYKDAPYVPSWAGFYAGVNGGYGWSDHNTQLADSDRDFAGLSPEGGFGGGQIGYNWQGMWHPHLVLGVEADIQGSGVEDSQSATLGLVTGHYKSDLNWFGTVRGRIGYAFDRALVYGTGGFAFGGIDNEVAYSTGVTYKSDTTATGYVMGGGVEYKFGPAWSAKAEYQYLNFGKNDPATASGTTYSSFTPVTKVDEDAFHTFRVGLNYHFMPGYEPLK